MAAEIDRAAIRADVLELADEDCYSFPEFYRSWDAAFDQVERSAVAVVVRAEIARLIDERVVRVHRGDQCTGDRRAPLDLDLTSDEFRSIDPAEWGPSGIEWLNVCNTELTKYAYAREWRNNSREKAR